MRQDAVGSLCSLVFLFLFSVSHEVHSQDLQSDTLVQSSLEEPFSSDQLKTELSEDGRLAHSSASAQSKANGPWTPYFPGSGGSASQAHAQASSSNGGYPRAGLNNVPSPYQGFPGFGQGHSSSSASATALANPSSNYPYSPYRSLGPSGSQAHASAISQGSGSSSASADASAYFKDGRSETDASYEDEASARTDVGLESLFVDADSRTSSLEAEAEADVEADSELQEPVNNKPVLKTSGVFSRLIPHREYIMPHLLPGNENSIHCSREGEFHSLWSPQHQCMVCACIRQSVYLSPVCVSCSGCTVVPIEPVPEPVPIPVPPPPEPESQVSCDPLPTNTPFQNPMNECQVCICRKSVSSYGHPDIQIECEENPQCLLPPDDIIPIPPMPIPPAPVPMPLCERFPPNVLFPHPNDVCKICKCIVEALPFGVPEQRIICQPNPECEPIPLPEPIPSPIPIPFPPPMPIPEPIPVPEPIPYPDIIPVPEPIPEPEPEPVPAPIPWPPIVPIPPAPPGPLPGPPPHESCRPYPPNLPFQHPWDECQLCVCSEIYSTSIINIEVNCYTKPSCCIIPPIPELPRPQPLPLPGPVIPMQPHIKLSDKVCEYKTLEVDFLHPQDICRICRCRLFGDRVSPVCKRAPRPECFIDIPYLPGISAEASAHANAQADSLSHQIGQYTPSHNLVHGYIQDQQYNLPLLPSGPGLYYPGSHSSATAEATASTVNQKPLRNRPDLLGGFSDAQASASAESDANVYSSDSSNGQALADSEANVLYQEGTDTTASAQSFANALSNANSASAQALSNADSLYSNGLAESQASASAQAVANGDSPYFGELTDSLASARAQSFTNAFPNGNYQYFGGLADSQASAKSQTVANTLSNAGSTYPGNFADSQASAKAQSLANALTNGNYQYYGGLADSQAYVNSQTLANALSNAGSVYPSSLADSQAKANTQASQAFANAVSNINSLYSGSQVEAQALANARTSGNLLYPGSSLDGQPNLNSLYTGSLSGTQALANAQSTAQIESLNQYAIYPYSLSSQPVPAPPSYPPLYPSSLTYLQYPGLGGYDRYSKSNAAASAESQGSLQTQSSATAIAGQSITKSGADGGEPDEE